MALLEVWLIGVGLLRFQKPACHAIPISLCLYGSESVSSFTVPVPCLPACLPVHALCRDDNEL